MWFIGNHKNCKNITGYTGCENKREWIKYFKN